MVRGCCVGDGDLAGANLDVDPQDAADAVELLGHGAAAVVAVMPSTWKVSVTSGATLVGAAMLVFLLGGGLPGLKAEVGASHLLPVKPSIEPRGALPVWRRQ